MAAALLCASAAAHDTWLAWREGAPPGQVWLALGTGDDYPRMSSPIGRADLREAACRTADGQRWPLQAQRVQGAALWLQARAPAQAEAGPVQGCWAETRPQTIELSPAEVQAYLREIRAPAALRVRWAEESRAGARWVEQFSKHARIERQAADAAPRQGAGMALDIVLETAAPAAGQALVVQVLRDGQPLAGQALQLLGEQAPQGLWLQTGEDGRARLRAPTGGAWLLRGTDLRPPDKPGGAWRSRFVTLAFEVAEP